MRQVGSSGRVAEMDLLFGGLSTLESDDFAGPKWDLPEVAQGSPLARPQMMRDEVLQSF